MGKYLSMIIITSMMLSCNSVKEPEVIFSQACSDYDVEYDHLKKITSDFLSRNLSEYYLGKLNDTEEDIEKSVATLKAFKCNTAKDTKFATGLLDTIGILINRQKKINAEEIFNGEDMFMDGIKLANYKVIYDENIQPSIEVSIKNSTKVPINSVVIQVQYCDRRFKKGVFEEDDPDCYENILIKGGVAAFSNRVITSRIDANKILNPNRTEVIIYKIVRQDGTLIKRLNHKGLFDK